MAVKYHFRHQTKISSLVFSEKMPALAVSECTKYLHFSLHIIDRSVVDLYLPAKSLLLSFGCLVVSLSAMCFPFPWLHFPLPIFLVCNTICKIHKPSPLSFQV